MGKFIIFTHFMIQRYFFTLCFLLFSFSGFAEESSKKQIYVIHLQQEINAPALRIVNKGMREALATKSDYIILHLNTYGGEVQAADSIRTAIMQCPIPVLVFIDNQAASAGALIAIACDSIYMRSGGSMGAAAVVNQMGEVLPEKQQSFMRSMMRATAESHGKRQVWRDGNLVEAWYRDPLIAEAMVGSQTVIDGIMDSSQILTFTADEALANGYCEGKAESIQEIILLAGLEPAEIKEYKPSILDVIILFLMNPLLQGLLLMLIIGGIYFELQTPGIGFPLILAITAAVLYFAPLYLEGLAENWELLLFVAGLVLIALEIFVIPGFGVAGISGILLCVVGLVLAMINNDLLKTPEGLNVGILVKPVVVVCVGSFSGLLLSIYLTRKLYNTRLFGRIALKTDLTETSGYIGVPQGLEHLIGQTGMAYTSLRPSGKIEILGEIYDAVAAYGMIDKGKKIKVTKYETGQLYCTAID